MKYAVGYQLAEQDEEPFPRLLESYREHISELYFPWMDMPTGRSILSVRRGYTDWTAQERLEKDLSAIKALGIKLDLLFNANCYGDGTLSRNLANKVVSVIDHLGERLGGVDLITTASPFIAHVVKSSFPSMEIRASVNMRIGTVKGMAYMADLFDSFYVQREYNRNLDVLEELKGWADANNKGLLLIANSGCLNFCSGQTFHDNLVAHEAGCGETDNLEGFIPHTCWRFFRDRKNWPAVLQNSWIRPEDVHYYEGLVKVMKLATRMHALPGLVLQAYTSGRYYGNLLDLCEPGYGPVFAPHVIENSAFPEDWFVHTSSCAKGCHKCDYCSRVLEDVLIKTE
jgi:collagenase-like PrtC family protease